jgi:hypothetical protein
MLGIITYGSLINHQETAGMKTPPASIIPVKLSTFKRSFNQQPAWRKNSGKHSAVLNVQADEPNWFNGVCYCFYAFDFTALDNRERGYLRVAVHLDRISNYQGHSLPELEELFLYQGKREYQNDTLLPNPDYLDICLTGAKYWGEEFYRDFLDTTHINNGILLREYLQFS